MATASWDVHFTTTNYDWQDVSNTPWIKEVANYNGWDAPNN